MRFERKDHHVLYDHGLPAGFEVVPHGYKPFSYYVLGGIDIVGDAMRLDADVESDSSGDLTSMSDAGFGYDPRLSGFDIAEAAGSDVYESLRERARTPQKSSDLSADDQSSTDSSAGDSSDGDLSNGD